MIKSGNYSPNKMMKFEHRSQPLLTKTKFYLRVLRYTIFCFLVLGFSLGLGMVGYHFFNELSWLDSLLNASMILTGMGPIDVMKNNAAKWFASIYAIFSGVVFLSAVAVLLAPVVHRFFHKLHVEEKDLK